jgi:hypothetical protein
MVQTPHETATPGAANTSWQYYPARPRRFIAYRKRLFSRFTPPDAVPVTVLLETPTRCSIPSLRTGHDAIRDQSCNVPRLRGSFTAVGTGPADATVELILPCTDYCNKGTLTYLLQVAVKG